DPAKRRIAAAVIGLGQSLGITTVAEGIETEAEANIMQNFGCDLGQGWLYGKGEPAEKALRRLKRQGSELSRKPLNTSPFQQLHQMETIYTQVPVGLCFLDKEFRYARTNDRFADIHGLKPSDLKGKALHDILDDKQREHALRVLQLLMDTGEGSEE